MQHTRDDILQAVLLLKARAKARQHVIDCFLDALPAPPVSGRSHVDAQPMAPSEGLMVNSSLRYFVAGESAAHLGEGVENLSDILSDCDTAWVREVRTGIWTPFGVRGEWVELVQSLKAGQPAPNGLGDSMRRVLSMAQILVEPGHEQALKASWRQTRQDAQTSYRQSGLAVLRNLIHPLHLGAIRRYYRDLVASGKLPLGDSQVPDRYWMHSESFARFLHGQLAELTGYVVGAQIKPSYVYFAAYNAGAALARHVDREQCQFSISLQVDFSPERDGPCEWPLYMESPGPQPVVHAVDLGIGDAVIYRGRELMHYRHPLGEGCQSMSIFLHYVRADFSGRLW